MQGECVLPGGFALATLLRKVVCSLCRKLLYLWTRVLGVFKFDKCRFRSSWVFPLHWVWARIREFLCFRFFKSSNTHINIHLTAPRYNTATIHLVHVAIDVTFVDLKCYVSTLLLCILRYVAERWEDIFNVYVLHRTIRYSVHLTGWSWTKRLCSLTLYCMNVVYSADSGNIRFKVVHWTCCCPL